MHQRLSSVLGCRMHELGSGPHLPHTCPIPGALAFWRKPRMLSPFVLMLINQLQEKAPAMGFGPPASWFFLFC